MADVWLSALYQAGALWLYITFSIYVAMSVVTSSLVLLASPTDIESSLKLNLQDLSMALVFIQMPVFVLVSWAVL